MPCVTSGIQILIEFSTSLDHVTLSDLASCTYALIAGSIATFMYHY